MFARKGEMRGLPIRYRGKTRRGGCNVLGLYGLRASALTIVRRSGALSAMLTGTDREAHGGATWTMVARPRATYPPPVASSSRDGARRHRAMGAAARAAGIGLRSPFSTPQRSLFSECHLYTACPRHMRLCDPARGGRRAHIFVSAIRLHIRAGNSFPPTSKTARRLARLALRAWLGQSTPQVPELLKCTTTNPTIPALAGARLAWYLDVRACQPTWPRHHAAAQFVVPR